MTPGMTSCLVILHNFFGKTLVESLAASLRKYRPPQADPCSHPGIRSKSKTGKLKRKEAKGTERMPFLLSSQSNKVGKSPEANTGMRRHTSPAHEALPHLPCRESSPSGPGGGSSDQVPRASGGGPRACNSTLSGAGNNCGHMWPAPLPASGLCWAARGGLGSPSPGCFSSFHQWATYTPSARTYLAQERNPKSCACSSVRVCRVGMPQDDPGHSLPRGPGYGGNQKRPHRTF